MLWYVSAYVETQTVDFGRSDVDIVDRKGAYLWLFFEKTVRVDLFGEELAFEVL